MRRPERFSPWAVIPVVGGLLWLGAGEGLGHLFSLPTGLLLSATGVSLFLWPADPRITRYMALGGLFGLLLAPFFWAFDDGALLAVALSAASFVLAGREGLKSAPGAEGIPEPPRELGVYAKAAVDEALLAYFVGTARVPSGAAADEAIAALKAQRDAVAEGGWDRNPEALHPRPEAPEHVEWQSRRALGMEFRALHFESGFTANAELPGAGHYMRYTSNRQTAAWVFEHEGENRPWLVCIHGYRMGHPLLDFTLFPPRLLHEKYGLNLLMPVLPLHGPRRTGLRTGDEFLDGDLRDLLHAECQSLWDLRRHLAWLRSHGAEQIGVMGFSLGGYNTALLCQYEHALDFAIAGIPVADLPAVLWPSLPMQHQGYFAEHGADAALLRQVLAPVAALGRAPLLPADRRFVFGGLADRLVPPPEVARLASHWQVEPVWYPGGHLTFRGSGVVTRELRRAMTAADWPRHH